MPKTSDNAKPPTVVGERWATQRWYNLLVCFIILNFSYHYRIFTVHFVSFFAENDFAINLIAIKLIVIKLFEYEVLR